PPVPCPALAEPKPVAARKLQAPAPRRQAGSEGECAALLRPARSTFSTPWGHQPAQYSGAVVATAWRSVAKQRSPGVTCSEWSCHLIRAALDSRHEDCRDLVPP